MKLEELHDRVSEDKKRLSHRVNKLMANGRYQDFYQYSKYIRTPTFLKSLLVLLIIRVWYKQAKYRTRVQNIHLSYIQNNLSWR